jgi:hypothetical protein
MKMNSYNIGWEVVENRCVSTAMIPTTLSFGLELETFETLIWEWDEMENRRRGILHQIHHASKEEAIKVHNYIVNNLKPLVIRD